MEEVGKVAAENEMESNEFNFIRIKSNPIKILITVDESNRQQFSKIASILSSFSSSSFLSCIDVYFNRRHCVVIFVMIFLSLSLSLFLFPLTLAFN